MWLARRTGYPYSLILRICALRDLRRWAMLDAAAFRSGTLPRRANAEFDRVGERELRLSATGAAP